MGEALSILGFADVLTQGLQHEVEKVRQSISGRIEGMGELPFPPDYALDPEACMILYVCCRLLKPKVVVETGVANGLSSFYILSALEAEKVGKLFSIDLPPFEQGQGSPGSLVPPELRCRWELIIDDSIKGLRRLFMKGMSVDLFLHDSEHTYSHMKSEFDIVWPNLAVGGILLGDDAESNSAFERAVSQAGQRGDAVTFNGLGILRKNTRSHYRTNPSQGI